MSIIFDAVLLGIFILTIIIHIRKGFIDSLLQTFSAVIAAVSAVLFGPRLGELLRDRVFGERFAEKIYEIIEPMFSFVEDKVNVSGFLAENQAGTGEFADLISRMGISIEALIQSFGEIDYGTEEDIRNMARSIAVPVTETISEVSGYVLVFLGMLLALFILRNILKLVVKLPVLKQTNQLLGAVLGMICGGIYVWLICLVLGGVVEYGLISDAEGILYNVLNGSYLYNLFLNITLNDFMSLQ